MEHTAENKAYNSGESSKDAAELLADMDIT